MRFVKPNKTKECRCCKEKINAKATVCPHCQQKQGDSCLTALIKFILYAVILAVGVPLIVNACNDIENAYENNTSISITRQDSDRVKPPHREGESLGQRNALDSAIGYVDLMGFSYSKLVEQLEFEGYSHEDALYGATYCGADWNAEAAESAKSYLDTMPMSRQQLYDQLIFEGYTSEQAAYGLQAVGY